MKASSSIFSKSISLLMISLLISCSVKKTIVNDIPPLTKVGEKGYITSEFIYDLNNKPTPECHASTIAETSSGLVAAWFGGTHEKNKDVGIWVSRQEAGNWSKPIEVANGVQSGDLRYPCWNPVLFLPQNGPLMLFYKVGPSPRDWWGMLMTSDDGGKTWATPKKLGEGPLGHLIGPVKNKPIQLTDGTILCPSSTETEIEGKDYWKVHFESTNDNGKSWQVTGPINDGVKYDAIQPSILSYPNEKMQILCRSRQDVITQSWSEDGGKTWSEMTATSLPNPSAGTDALTLQDGRQLLVYNHTTRRKQFPSSRNMLNIAISEDGINWEPVMTLERQKGEYSYPAVIQSNDGMVHITYTYQRQTVKYVKIDPAKLQ